MMVRLLFASMTLVAFAQQSRAENQPGKLRLTLPSEMYAVVGTEMSFYFDNIVLTETPGKYGFDVRCKVGQTEPHRWRLIAKPVDVGTHDITVTVSDAQGTVLGQASTQLHVAAADSGADRKITLLIVGDSLTHATLYPNELARLLSQPNNPTWRMFGTHRPKSAAEGVAHEGYGGWTWQRFVSKYEPKPDGTYRKRSSPFVFLNESGKPELNVAKYLDEECSGERPDYVFFLLGINDCFSANPDDQAAIDARIDAMLKPGNALVSAFREAAPKASLAICVTTPPNSREAAFEANYKGRFPRWGWKRIQHRLVERLLSQFEKREAEQLFVVPTQLNLDPVAGYPVNNGVHPNAVGYQQIGASIYSWMKWRFSQ
jgi:lysophospholipase L1-like esterase